MARLRKEGLGLGDALAVEVLAEGDVVGLGDGRFGGNLTEYYY
jgi:hypothetical protein